ncbi:hypothetical protein HC031_25005 [Planosporangium thailandense]|uniref:D-isomer specific 2-hydroxyacid dehydrogenase NAD-binding domain-containing protein n=1 Tax=Planosporangium thailandense TaxID=765197 RepID=A0ABX0Y3I8_9ACTN|nr:NAD(P)-dependent oxidoreductase [Planosporangium thailandense]NJC72951.1 hypothetical protein [Planosporangium thailandense]
MTEAIGTEHHLVPVDGSRSLIEQVADVDVVVDAAGAASPDLARAAAGSMLLWQLTSVGYDKYDVGSLLDHRIPTANCPGFTSASGLAEWAMTLASMVLRRWSEIGHLMRSGRTDLVTGRQLHGRTLLVLGLGASGRAIVRLARAHGMRVICVRRAGPDDRLAKKLGLARLTGLDELDETLPMADVVSLHIPLTGDTENILDRRRMALMRPGAVIVNVSRGGLLDEPALAELVRAGHLGGAGLDVLAKEPPDPGNPLLDLPQVVVTPHVAGLTDRTSKRRALFCARNISRVGAGREPLSRICSSQER